MSPIVIRNVPIVFLHAQQPAAKYVVIDMEPLDKVQVEEHPEARGERLVILHVYVVEFEIVQLKVRRRRDSQTLLEANGKFSKSHRDK